jgi:hypothetical protein
MEWIQGTTDEDEGILGRHTSVRVICYVLYLSNVTGS